MLKLPEYHPPRRPGRWRRPLAVLLQGGGGVALGAGIFGGRFLLLLAAAAIALVLLGLSYLVAFGGQENTP